MIAHDGMPFFAVNLGRYGIADLYLAGRYGAGMNYYALVIFKGIADRNIGRFAYHTSGIAGLSTAFGIKRGGIKNHGYILAGLGR